MRNRFDRGWNFKSTQVRASKNVASIRRRRLQSKGYRNAGVQSDAAHFDWLSDSGLSRTREIHALHTSNLRSGDGHHKNRVLLDSSVATKQRLIVVDAASMRRSRDHSRARRYGLAERNWP